LYLAVNVFTPVSPAATTELLDLARIAEELGYDEFDLGDHVTVGRPMPERTLPDPPGAAVIEPLVTLGAISAVPQRIRLGTGVLILPQRQPALVAKQVATLDRLSHGRIRLVVGVGWQAPEYESLGVPFDERGSRMDEAIRLIRLYWTGSSVTFQGRFYRCDAMAVDPPPIQSGGPPIWLGGSSEAALRRIGRLADGWLAVGESLARVKDKVSIISRAASEARRDPDSIGLHALLGDITDLEHVASEASAFREIGFSGASINLDPVIAAAICSRTHRARIWSGPFARSTPASR
jgi:probable F420-dependent oxidoreductase